jgi:hypothetical protein
LAAHPETLHAAVRRICGLALPFSSFLDIGHSPSVRVRSTVLARLPSKFNLQLYLDEKSPKVARN